jgi:hypothetical protein
MSTFDDPSTRWDEETVDWDGLRQGPALFSITPDRAPVAGDVDFDLVGQSLDLVRPAVTFLSRRPQSTFYRVAPVTLSGTTHMHGHVPDFSEHGPAPCDVIVVDDDTGAPAARLEFGFTYAGPAGLTRIDPPVGEPGDIATVYGHDLDQLVVLRIGAAEIPRQDFLSQSVTAIRFVVPEP